MTSVSSNPATLFVVFVTFADYLLQLRTMGIAARRFFRLMSLNFEKESSRAGKPVYLYEATRTINW